MNDNELRIFRFGYDECRAVVIGSLKKIVSGPDAVAALQDYVENLEEDREREHWQLIQEEQPGITRKEYGAQLAEAAESIGKEFYSEKGYLKPRLIGK